MGSSERTHRIPTRRETLRGGGALIAGGMLAGCASQGPVASSTDTTSESATDPSRGPFTVSMAPMGDVEFDTPPERAFVVFPQYADMAVALGKGSTVNALYVPEMAGTTMNHYYARLDDVSFDWEGLPDSLTDGVRKEQLYGLDSDVHFVDPAWLSTQNHWRRDDIEDVQRDIAPMFGNFYSGTHAKPPVEYRDQYQYYGLWEMFGAVARIFQEEKRYQALADVHTSLLSTIEANLPPKAERPTAVRVTLSDGQFYTYHLNSPGYWLADTRPLGAIDAFGDEEWDQWGTVGYEAMLDADPDVILHLWGMTPRYDMAKIRETLEQHAVGRQLSAVQNDRVYAHGMRYQGPIMNLFQIEMTAKQLYPEVFGNWPGYTNGTHYPEIPTDERLFDRQRVADIVNGAIDEEGMS